MDNIEALRYRIAPLEMTPSEFRKVGYQMIERIAEFLCTLLERPVTPDESPQVVREVLGIGSLPKQGSAAKDVLEEAANLLFEHSTFNGHPRFLAMITSSAAPIGALGDLLAAAVNPNVGGWALAPIATEMEAQTIRWIAELIGYPIDCGGLLVSGGNMGNFLSFLVARTAKVPWDVRTAGLTGGQGRHCVSTPHKRRIPGSTRPLTCLAWESRPFAGFPSTHSYAWTQRLCASRFKQIAKPVIFRCWSSGQQAR